MTRGAGNGCLIAGLSDIGCRRTSNQDVYGVYELPIAFGADRKLRCAVVADGMGGHAGGAAASRAALEAVERHLQAAPPHSPDDVVAFLHDVFRAAEEQVLESRSKDESEEKSGTTLVVALSDGADLWCANVGDSRLYVVDENGTRQVTTDHTLVAEIERAGTAEHTDLEGVQGVLTRAIGRGISGGRWEPDVVKVALSARADVLLCSDGLYRYFDAGELGEIVSTSDATAEEIAGRLISLARGRGGADNITALLLRFGLTASTHGLDLWKLLWVRSRNLGRHSLLSSRAAIAWTAAALVFAAGWMAGSTQPPERPVPAVVPMEAKLTVGDGPKGAEVVYTAPGIPDLTIFLPHARRLRASSQIVVRREREQFVLESAPGRKAAPLGTSGQRAVTTQRLTPGKSTQDSLPDGRKIEVLVAKER